MSVPINPFFKVRSKNRLMYYNAKDFLHNWGRQQATGNEPLSSRIMELVGNTFSRWHGNWYHHVEYPDLGHLRDHIEGEDKEAALKAVSIPERKGLTIKLMLGEILTGSDVGRKADVYRIDPREIIVGVIPATSFPTIGRW
jgi:hypothetical protein